MARSDDLRSAADAITKSGLDKNVISTSERNLTDRGARQRSQQRHERDYNDRDDNDAYDDHDAYDDTDSDDVDEFEDDDFEDDADTRSNRQDGGDEDDGEDDDGQEDGNDTDDESDELGEAEKRKQSDDDDERLYDVTVQGETFQVSQKELVNGYQRQADYHHKTTELARRRRDLDSAHANAAQAYQTQLQRNANVLNIVKNALAGDINSVDMQRLRSEDPARWAVERQNIQDRIDAFNHILAQVDQEQERHKKQVEETRNHELSQFAGQELENLQRHVPDWKDRKGKVAAVLTGDYGFSPDEINGVYDSRMLAVAADAQRWREFQAAKQNAKSKRKRNKAKGPAPKRPQHHKSQIKRQGSPQRRQQRAFGEARSKARKTGSMRDAGKAISLMDLD